MEYAESKKTEGNQYYVRKNYLQALNLYSEAIGNRMKGIKSEMTQIQNNYVL